jgi:hypothetical protein
LPQAIFALPACKRLDIHDVAGAQDRGDRGAAGPANAFRVQLPGQPFAAQRARGLARRLQADTRAAIAGIEDDRKLPRLHVAQRGNFAQRRAPIVGDIDDAHRSAEPALLIEAHKSIDQHLARQQLQFRIECRTDRQATLIQLLFAIAGDEIAADFLCEIASHQCIRRKRARIDAQRRFLGLLSRLRRHMAIIDHAVENIGAALQRTVAIAERMQVAGRFRQRGQIGGFRQRQFMHRLAVIAERSSGHAIVVEAEVDFIEIEFEDLLFRIGRLDTEREQRFANLALKRPLVGEQEVLGDLLRDRRSALDAAVATDHDHRSAGDAFRIDARMGIEILVFRRKEGLLHEVGNRRTRQEQAALARVLSKQRSVRSVHARHHRRFVIAQLRVVGQILLVAVDEQPDRRRADQKDDRAGSEQKPEKTTYPTHKMAFRSLQLMINHASRLLRRRGPRNA